MLSPLMFGILVAPFTGAWIEMYTLTPTYEAVTRRTLHGCVD